MAGGDEQESAVIQGADGKVAGAASAGQAATTAIPDGIG